LFLKGLEINNFRNFEHAQASFSDGLNIILGKNAQGKTNLLEAITICALGKSYKNAKNDDMVMFQRNDFFIRCSVHNSSVDKVIEVYYKKGDKKYIRVNGTSVQKISDLFGNLNVVVFIPDDLKLLKQGPSDRRRFVDMDLVQIKPDYYHNMLQYFRVLKQRNNILKNQKQYDMVKIWDEQLAWYGSRIVKERMAFVDKLSKAIKRVHPDFMPEVGKVQINYLSTVKKTGDLERNYREKLRESIHNDIKFKTTTCGPHRDDIVFLIDGVDARYFASQGQQRSLILSLKLAEMEIFKESIGEYPILLLDDVLSELDSERQRSLLSSLSNYQAIITGTHIQDDLFICGKRYLVDSGQIKEF